MLRRHRRTRIKQKSRNSPKTGRIFGANPPTVKKRDPSTGFPESPKRPIPPVLKKYKKRQRWDAILDRLPQGEHLVGAEIGVLNANTASRILRERPLLKHFMIDPWCVPDKGSSYEESADTNALKSADEHEKAYQKTLALTNFAGARAVVMRMMSHEAVTEFEDESLDFVFIDGDHSYDGVKLDIKLWLPKVKKGGWIGFHDYDHPRLPGVKQAIDEAFDIKVLQFDDNRTAFYYKKD